MQSPCKQQLSARAGRKWCKGQSRMPRTGGGTCNAVCQEPHIWAASNTDSSFFSSRVGGGCSLRASASSCSHHICHLPGKPPAAESPISAAATLIKHPPPSHGAHSSWGSPFPAPFTLQPSSLSPSHKSVSVTPGQKQAVNHTQTFLESHASSAMG